MDVRRLYLFKKQHYVVLYRNVFDAASIADKRCWHFKTKKMLVVKKNIIYSNLKSYLITFT